MSRAPMLPMRTLRGNTIANLAGRIVPGLLAIAAVPLLIRLLGAEAFGIVGLFAVLQIALTSLDVGLATTATREIAQDFAEGRAGAESRMLVRTLEVPYWLLGALAACVLSAASGWLATEWLNVRTLSTTEVSLAFVLAGIALGVRWPVGLYRGVLDGLQLQVIANAIIVGAAAIRVLGGLAVVAAISRTITAFMAWQAIASGLEVVAMRFAVKHNLPRGEGGARFAFAILRRVWRFALALSLVGALGLVLTQVDRIVISKSLPLAQLGYYTVAATAAGIVPHLAAAVSTAVLPRFAGELGAGVTSDLRRTYRVASHVVAFSAVGASLPLALFSSEIMIFWTGSEQIAEATATPLRLLAIAYLLNALYSIPYTLAIGRGYTRTAVIVNAVEAPLVAAAMYALVPRWGLTGAAAIWLVLMSVNLIVYVVSINRLVLRRQWSQVVGDVFPYVILGVAIFGAGRIIVSAANEQVVFFAVGVAAMAGYLLVGASLLPFRNRFGQLIGQRTIRLSRRTQA